MDKVTVITPCYNSSATMFEAVGSVLCQTYHDIEYIIIDDGSDSFNMEQLESFIQAGNSENVQVRIMQNACNLGITKTMNIAARQATGELLFFLAADDRFHDKDVVADWAKQFAVSGAQVITARREVYGSDFTQSLGILPNDEDALRISTLGPVELFEFMSGKNLIFGCCTARTRRCFEQFGGFDEHYRLIEDYPSNLRLLRSGIPIGFFDRVVVDYRNNGISSAKKINKTYLKDSDRIFKCEVLPFVHNVSRAKREYREWKVGVFSAAKQEQLQSSNSTLERFFIYLGLAARHPLYYIKKFLCDPKKVCSKLFASRNNTKD